MHNLRKDAQRVQQAGRYGDTILAHINPMEAMELSRQSGNGGINPSTGVREHFAFLPLIAAAATNYFVTKKATGSGRAGLGSMIGSVLGGPIGGAVGGGIGGSMGPRDKRVGFGRGALGGFGGSMAGMGVGNMGSNLAAGNGLFNGQGISGLFGSGNGGFMDSLTGAGGVGGASNGAAGGKGGGMLGGLFGGGGLDSLLMGTTLLGSLGKKKLKWEGGQTPEEAGENLRRMQKAAWGPEHAPRNVKPLERKYVQPFKGHNPQFGGEHEYFGDVNPLQQYYAQGGYVKGDSSGQEDNRQTYLPKDAYVMNSTDVSLLGDGNSDKGAQDLGKMEQNFWHGGFVRGGEEEESNRKPNAYVSDGEYVIKPKTVKAIGGGSAEKGIKKLNTFRKNLRKQKGVKQILPPKTKNISSYFKG